MIKQIVKLQQIIFSETNTKGDLYDICKRELLSLREIHDILKLEILHSHLISETFLKQIHDLISPIFSSYYFNPLH